MHSRLYVLRQVEDGIKLPLMNDRSCVTEDDLADSFVPSHADYVGLIKESDGWDDDVNWIASCYKEFFTKSKVGDETFLTLDVSKALDFLKEKFKRFKAKADEITFNDFSAPYSMNMYDMQTAINDESGFWIITITENSGWWYDTIDSFLRTHCSSKDSPKQIKFRVEDIFDYHY